MTKNKIFTKGALQKRPFCGIMDLLRMGWLSERGSL